MRARAAWPRRVRDELSLCLECAAAGCAADGAVGCAADAAVGCAADAAVGCAADAAVGCAPFAAVGCAPFAAVGCAPFAAVGCAAFAAVGCAKFAAVGCAADAATVASAWGAAAGCASFAGCSAVGCSGRMRSAPGASALVPTPPAPLFCGPGPVGSRIAAAACVAAARGVAACAPSCPACTITRPINTLANKPANASAFQNDTPTAPRDRANGLSCTSSSGGSVSLGLDTGAYMLEALLLDAPAIAGASVRGPNIGGGGGAAFTRRAVTAGRRCEG